MWISLGGSQERFWTGPRPEVRELVLLFCTCLKIVKPGLVLLLAATHQSLPRRHAESMIRRAAWQRLPPSLEERTLTVYRFLSTGERHWAQVGVRPTAEAPGHQSGAATGLAALDPA